MNDGKRKRTLQERIRAGELTRKDVIRRLAELAYGKVNDCVRLALETEPCLEELDLSLLSDVKRNEKGMVEIRLVDRLKVLEQLAGMTAEDREGVEGFLQALQGSGEKP